MHHTIVRVLIRAGLIKREVCGGFIQPLNGYAIGRILTVFGDYRLPLGFGVRLREEDNAFRGL